MKRYLYSSTISEFLKIPETMILGFLSENSEFSDEGTQKLAWREEIKILKQSLLNYQGTILFEFSIPQMGKKNSYYFNTTECDFRTRIQRGRKRIFTECD